MEQFVVSAIKYRPLSFSSVVGQSSIGTTLKNAIQRGHLSHAYLFCGPRGVGKTTCARIFAKTINCLNLTPDMEACGVCESCRSFAEGRSYSIHELDAASNNSVEDIRLLIDKVRIPPQIGKYSVYIIDEVHMLSTAAFNAFLKTLEEPPAHAIFILATTEKHKILPTILSRCQIYDFSRITTEDTVKHLEEISVKEGVKYEPEALNIIARKADGAMRDALSIFDRVVSFCGNNITYKAVIEDLNVLDYEYYFKLTDAFIEGRYADAYVMFDEILKKGFDSQHFISGLSSHFRDLLMCKSPKTITLLEVSKTVAERYIKQSEICTPYFLFEALNVTNKCETGYKMSSNPRLHVELTLLNLSNIGSEKKNEFNEQQLEEPETKPSKTKVKEGIAEREIPKAPETISLKNIFSKPALEAKQDTVTEPVEESSIIDEPDHSVVIEVWKKYAGNISLKKPRLSGRLLEHTPKVKNNVIVYPVINEQHKEQMHVHAIDLIEYLRNELNRYDILIEWEITESIEITEPTKPMLYTTQDKLKHMISKNSAIELMRRELDLDFR